MFRFLLLCLILISFACSENPTRPEEQFDLNVTDLRVLFRPDFQFLTFYGTIQNDSNLVLNQVEIRIKLAFEGTASRSKTEISHPDILLPDYSGQFIIRFHSINDCAHIKNMEIVPFFEGGTGVKEVIDNTVILNERGELLYYGK